MPGSPGGRPYGVPVTRTAPSTRTSRATVIAIAVLAGLFHAAFAAFLLLYSAVDSWAVDRSEATGAFDPSQLLPHGEVLWVVARCAAVLLVVLDVVVIATVVRERGRPRARAVGER